jgi:hypothetical protein
MIYYSDIHIIIRVNKFFKQPIYNGITLIIHVRVKHFNASAVKNRYYIKSTAAAGVGFTIGVWSVCVYIFYIARGDQVKFSSIFGKGECWGVWSSCARI